MRAIFIIVMFFLMGCAGIKHETTATVPLTTFRALDSLQQVSQKSVFVLVHTDWCRYCELMKQTTLQQSEIVSLLKNDFYSIYFDAESQEEVPFRNKKYAFQPSGNGVGIHSLVYELADHSESVAYPMLVLLDTTNQVIARHKGYLDRKNFYAWLKENTDY